MSDSVNNRNEGTYEFDGFSLDGSKRLLWNADRELVPLMPKAFELLLYLVHNSQRVIEKEELIAEVWPDTIVEENNLTQNISVLRKALGETRGENRFIATVPGRGYKFVAEVKIGERHRPEPGGQQSIPHSGGAGGQPTMSGRASRFTKAAVAIGVLAALIALVVPIVYFQIGKAPVTSSVRSMAILPFKPIGNVESDESLELGMTDTLIRKMSGAQTISIRPFTAVRRFGAVDQDSIAAGRELGVDAVLDGSLQIVDDRIRVNAELLRVSDSKQLWIGQFDEKLRDIFSIQDSIAEKVAGELRLTLAGGRRKSYTESLEAYQLYVRGNLHSRRLVRSEVEKAIAYYQKAIEIDPAYALAYVEMANAHRALVLTSDAPPNEMMPKAKAAAAKAVELDDGIAEAWTALAISDFWYDWDWQRAEKHHKKALELQPNSSIARFFYAHLLSNIGRHTEAVAEIRRAREIEPANLLVNAVEGQILFFAGDIDGAEKVLKETIDLDANFWLAHLFITRVYLSRGENDSAITAARKAAELSDGSAEATATIGFALAKSGRTDEARTILDELRLRAKSRYVPAYTIATLHAGLGEREMALDQLEQAFANRDALMVFLRLEPKWDELRGDARFAKLIDNMNFN